MNNYGTNGSTIFNLEDGVVINLKEIKKLKEQQAVENFNQSLEELNDLGLSSSLMLVKYKNREYECIDIKRDYEFNKEFRVELRDIMLDKKLSKNARCFIGTLSPFISFPSNAIHIKYKNPTFDDLMDILDMSKNTLNGTITELIDNNIIVKVKLDGQMIIYFNPFLYCAGYCIEKSTYEKFKDSIYNPVK